MFFFLWSLTAIYSTNKWNIGLHPQDSGYEALLLEDGIFYTIRESIEMEKEEFHAIVEELQVVDDDYTMLAACPTEFEFEGDR